MEKDSSLGLMLSSAKGYSLLEQQQSMVCVLGYNYGVVTVLGWTPSNLCLSGHMAS